jgi:hypothetical protein
MFVKSLAVAAGSAALALVASGTAMAGEVCTGESDGFGGSTVAVTGSQSGAVTIDSDVVDGRCAAPWYGSAVIGGSTPIGSQNLVCDDIKAPIYVGEHNSKNGVL